MSKPSSEGLEEKVDLDVEEEKEQFIVNEDTISHCAKLYSNNEDILSHGSKS